MIAGFQMLLIEIVEIDVIDDHSGAQSAVSFRIVFKLLDDYMLSPTENHLKMIDANVFVLAYFPL